MWRLIRDVMIVLLLTVAAAQAGFVDVGHPCSPTRLASDPGGSSGGTGGGLI